MNITIPSDLSEISESNMQQVNFKVQIYLAQKMLQLFQIV